MSLDYEISSSYGPSLFLICYTSLKILAYIPIPNSSLVPLQMLQSAFCAFHPAGPALTK